MTQVSELREMADEQIRLVWKDAAETLFRLRLQAQTEKIASPSDLRKQRQKIARCQTILAQRGSVVNLAGVVEVPTKALGHDHLRGGMHSKKRRAKDRAAIRASSKKSDKKSTANSAAAGDKKKSKTADKSSANATRKGKPASAVPQAGTAK